MVVGISLVREVGIRAELRRETDVGREKSGVSSEFRIVAQKVECIADVAPHRVLLG